MTSIRQMLTLRLLIVLGALMVVCGLALFFGIRVALTRQFDDTLRGRLVTLQSATRWDGQKIDLDFTSEIMPWYQPGPHAEYFEIREPSASDAGAAAVAKSPSFTGSSWTMPGYANTAASNIVMPGGRSGRIASLDFTPPPDEELDEPGKEEQRRRALTTAPALRVIAVMSREELDGVIRVVGISLLLAGVVLIVGLIAGVRLALHQGLAPLRRISDQVREIQADTLTERLTGDNLPEELRPIQQRLNELLERLQAAFAREQRFTSAAAHELRTPVAELRSLLEVQLSRPRSVDESRFAATEALDIALRMEGLVQSLLRFARASDPNVESAMQEVDPAMILLRVAGRHEEIAYQRGGSVKCRLQDGLRVLADPSILEIILDNLLANAIEYAEPIPSVTCELADQSDGSVTIDVQNPAVLTSQDVDRFFEPFWRRSQSRADQAHLGMGLVVAQGLAKAMGALLTAQLCDDKNVIVRLHMQGMAPEQRDRCTASGR